jgi:hypothetical protein
VDAEVDVLFSTDPDAADDPSVYPLPAAATEVDLAPAVRKSWRWRLRRTCSAATVARDFA